jgi:hypothetical protein
LPAADWRTVNGLAGQRAERRGPSDAAGLVDGAKDGAKAVANVAEDGAKAVASGAKDGAKAVTSGVESCTTHELG